MERNRRRVVEQAGSWAAENARCADGVEGCLYWIQTHLWIYDPRPLDATSGRYVQFKLWPKQVEMVKWLLGIIGRSEEGLVEKSRDVGASYLCLAVALWKWRYESGFKATFGSNLESKVDVLGDMDSLFEKLRTMAGRLPPEMLPKGFNWGRHSKSMNLINPENGAAITGEGGPQLGRSGRSTVVFVDEAAHVEHAERVEAALSGNTDCVIWVSSVNGMGNLFSRKRHEILREDQIFRLHWRDDPRKTEAWAAAKKASFSEPTTWASEYDIDYSASVEGICIPAAWVESAKRLLALEPRMLPSNHGVLGLDVGGGKAKSVAIGKKGNRVMVPKSRGEPDTTETALWGIECAKELGLAQIKFDAVGIGAGVSSTLMRHPVPGLRIQAVNTGIPPNEKRIWPDGRRSDEIFGNQKAEIWWLCRTDLQRTHEHVLWLLAKLAGIDPPDGAREHPVVDLLALPSGDKESDTLCQQLSLVKYFRDERGKIVIESKKQLVTRGIKSPDYAEALMLTYAPDTVGPMVISDEVLAMARASTSSRYSGRRERLG